jgi:predicted alpha/beta-fold hydrolase
MPLIKSDFHPSRLFKNGHFSTIYSAKIRPIPKLIQERERLHLPDGDFLDIDWSFSKIKTKKIAVLLHGLEGNAQRVYMKGQGRILTAKGLDVIAMNHRGCSGEDNLLYESYNSGRTSDLKFLMNFILEKDQYTEISIIGFSLGGNLILKYLGEHTPLPKELKNGVAISSPIHLKGSLDQLLKTENWIYSTVFLKTLKEKYKRKISKFPDKMRYSDYKKIKTLYDFDNLYTAPAHDFKNADDYYQKNSSIQFLPNIKIPVLILNAQNDPFLSSQCYPFEMAEKSNTIFLETPSYGGHVGFHVRNDLYYNEKRAFEFISQN